MPALYKIADARQILDRRLEESEGVLTPELEAELDALDQSADEKIERVALYLREQQLAADLVKQEEDRLALRRRAHLTTVDALKGYLLTQMQRLEKDKVRGKLLTVAVQANPPKVVGDVPPEVLATWHGTGATWVKMTPASFTVDRAKVLELVRAGHEPPIGLSVVQEQGIRIR